MAHFYSTTTGRAGTVTRCGTKDSGLTTTAAGWPGAINVYLSYDEKEDKDIYHVYQIPWKGKGEQRLLATGTLGE